MQSVKVIQCTEAYENMAEEYHAPGATELVYDLAYSH